MNILVYDVAAKHGGALTILKEFYDEVVAYGDKNIKWYFVVSVDCIKSTDNVEVIIDERSKKSWIHRWLYDHSGIQKLVKKYSIDRVFSLQNMVVSRVKKPQIVYFHQPLQFATVKFSPFKGSERNLWIRKNTVCRMIRKSLKKADKIVVQTKWMKEATIEWLNCDADKITIIPPQVELEEADNMEIKVDKTKFFYPAAPYVYKNHQLIVDACKYIKGKEYKVYFTTQKEESAQSKCLFEQIEQFGINIEGTGYLSKEEMNEMYRGCVLLFPSYLETFGLPLLEGRNSNAIVLAADTPFAREILEGYENAYFYEATDAKKLAEYMQNCIDDKIVQLQGTKKEVSATTENLIDVVISDIS